MMANARTDAWNGGLVFMLDIFVENGSVHSVVPERHPKESAADLQILMHLGAVLQLIDC
jgi:hypothetical protein